MDALSARRYSLELTEQTRKRKLSQPSVSHQQGEVSLVRLKTIVKQSKNALKARFPLILAAYDLVQTSSEIKRQTAKNVCDAPKKNPSRKRNENLILRFIFTGQSHVKAVEIVAVFLFDLDITGFIILNLGYDVFQLAVFFVRSVFAQFILSADQCSNPFFCNEVADKAVNELERIHRSIWLWLLTGICWNSCSLISIWLLIWRWMFSLTLGKSMNLLIFVVSPDSTAFLI